MPLGKGHRGRTIYARGSGEAQGLPDFVSIQCIRVITFIVRRNGFVADGFQASESCDWRASQQPASGQARPDLARLSIQAGQISTSGLVRRALETEGRERCVLGALAGCSWTAEVIAQAPELGENSLLLYSERL